MNAANRLQHYFQQSPTSEIRAVGTVSDAILNSIDIKCSFRKNHLHSIIRNPSKTHYKSL